MGSQAKWENRLRRLEFQRLTETGGLATIDDEDLPEMPHLLTLSVPEVVETLLEEAPATIRARAGVNARRLEEAIRDLEDSPALSRLHGLQQFGIKRDPGRVRTAQGEVVVTAPYLHTRGMHVRLVASHAIACASTLDLPFRDVATVAMAGYLHDVGHSAFSHDADHFLVRRGRPSHEARGLAIVARDQDIHETLSLLPITRADVESAMQERGETGELLKICDTAAYVLHDGLMTGTPPRTTAWQIMKSLEAVSRIGICKIRDPAPLQNLLIARAELSRDVYYTFANKLAAAALHIVLDGLERLGLLTYEDLEAGTDGSIERRFTRVFNNPDVSVPSALHSASRLAHGVLSELHAWTEHRFPSKEAMHAFLGQRSPEAVRTAILVEPFDFTKKEIAVRLRSGHIDYLRAPAALLTPTDKLWFVFLHQG